MSPVSMLNGNNLDRSPNNCKNATDNDGIVILSKSVSLIITMTKRRRTHPSACRPQRAQTLKNVVNIVNAVSIYVRVSSIPPLDSSGGSGFGA